MVNHSHSPVPHVVEKKKQYTAHDIKRANSKRIFQHIIVQPVKKILHAVDNNILQNFPILRDYVGMAEEIYETSVTHLQGKIDRYKFQHVEPVIVTKYPKVVLYRHRNSTLCWNIMHINYIGFFNIISLHILFSTVIMIKNRKMRNIEEGIK